MWPARRLLALPAAACLLRWGHWRTGSTGPASIVSLLIFGQAERTLRRHLPLRSYMHRVWSGYSACSADRTDRPRDRLPIGKQSREVRPSCSLAEASRVPLIADRTVAIVPLRLPGKSRIGHSGGGTMVIVQHSTQPFAALHRARVREMNWVRLNQPVVQTLMVPLAMIMSHEVLNGCPQ